MTTPTPTQPDISVWTHYLDIDLDGLTELNCYQMDQITGYDVEKPASDPMCSLTVTVTAKGPHGQMVFYGGRHEIVTIYATLSRLPGITDFGGFIMNQTRGQYLGCYERLNYFEKGYGSGEVMGTPSNLNALFSTLRSHPLILYLERYDKEGYPIQVYHPEPNYVIDYHREEKHILVYGNNSPTPTYSYDWTPLPHKITAS